MDKTMLTLKSGATLAERGGQTGLVLQGRVRFAKDARQTEILRALILQSQSLKSLMALLRARDDPQSENENSLTIAEFILDFSEFLES